MPGKYSISLPGTEVIRVEEPARVREPLYEAAGLQVGPEEYSLSVPGTGCFYAGKGKEVRYFVEPGADHEWVRLYLNGQVLVALLHQRKIINFHASSFVYNGRGVMVLGETGAGKSSVTLTFALQGGGFLTDDITPVVFHGGVPCVMPLNRRVKLRRDTALQLGIDDIHLTEAEAGTGKKYFRLAPVSMDPCPLDVIIKIEQGAVETPVFSRPSPADMFSLLRSEVCSWEILAGMPETETAYLQQLLKIVEQVRFVKIMRPKRIEISVLYEAVRACLAVAER